MARARQRDNITFNQKVMLRRTALSMLGDVPPVILETHGGWGDVYSAVYKGIDEGMVMDTDAVKTEALAKQRPCWIVYEAKAEEALAATAGMHLSFTLMDIDPYGSIWPTVESFFTSKRKFAPTMIVVTNCGLRHKLRGGGGWDNHHTAPYAAKYGNHRMFEIYPQLTKEMMANFAAKAGYEVTFAETYSTGVEQKMVHGLFRLVQMQDDDDQD